MNEEDKTKKSGMPDILVKRLSNLLTIKSLVTLILTGVFAILTYRGTLDQSFMTIYTAVISFYFGIQSAKSGGTE